MRNLLKESGYRLTITPDDLIQELRARLETIEIGSTQEVAMRTLWNRLEAARTQVTMFMSTETSQMIAAIEKGVCPDIRNVGIRYDDLFSS